MSLTPEEKKRAKTYAFNGAQFQFIPSASLSNMVASGDPRTEDINDQLKVSIMEKRHLRLATKMVVRYCDNKLDSKNTWLLDQGDIKVIPKQFQIKEKTDE